MMKKQNIKTAIVQMLEEITDEKLLVVIYTFIKYLKK
jgi:hypothetical protein